MTDREAEFVTEVDPDDFYGLGHRSEYEPGRKFVLKRRRVGKGPTHPSKPTPTTPTFPTCPRCGRAHFVGPTPSDPAYCAGGGVKR